MFKNMVLFPIELPKKKKKKGLTIFKWSSANFLCKIYFRERGSLKYRFFFLFFCVQGTDVKYNVWEKMEPTLGLHSLATKSDHSLGLTGY